MTTPRTRTLAAPAIAASAVLAIGLAAWPYTVDDAFVLARYAARLAAGDGWTMNDGPPTDGVTGPLGLVPGVVAALLGRDPVFASKLTGLLAGALAAALVARRAAPLTPSSALLPLLLASPLLAVWSVAGLETGVAVLAAAVAAVAALGSVAPDSREGRKGGNEEEEEEEEGAAPATDSVSDSATYGARGRAVALGLSVGCLAWLRPELAPFCLVLLLSLRSHRRWAWGLALTGAASVVFFRLSLFGHVLPLAAAAKPADLANGFGYVARALVVVFGLGGAVPVVLAAREDPARRPLALALGAHLVSVALAGGDWMPGFRLFAPVLPAYALVASGAVARRLPGWRGWALLAGATAIPLASHAFVLPLARDAGEAREEAGAELADWLAAHGVRVALVDIGYLGWRSGLEVVDLGGITDPEVARAPGGHVAKALDVGWLAARDPDLFVLSSRIAPRVSEDGQLVSFLGHPVEHRVARTAWFRARYRVARVVRYSPSTTYVVLARRGR